MAQTASSGVSWSLDRVGEALTRPAVLAASGMVVLFLTVGWRFYKTRQGIALIPALLAFLGGTTLPVSIVLIAYPFFDKPPDLQRVVLYIPVAGLSLLYLFYATIKQSAVEQVPEVEAPGDSTSGSDPK